MKVSQPSSRSLRERILERAHAAGFALAGLARVPELARQPRADVFSEWLAAGRNGPLAYLARRSHMRENLHDWYPWVRSVLVVGAFYDGAPRGRPGRDFEAHVARYARGRDYHAVFKKRLRVVEQSLLRERLCAHARNFVDTGPMIERAWAERAGLGWTGKNACLIHPRLGSFLVLGGLVLDTDAEPDAPASAHCGTCRRCLDACPTQALVAPGVLDARRCLTTYSIESKGRMPPELWELSGAWAAGCDVCQTVCPFNAPAFLPPSDPELGRPLPWQELTLDAVILLDRAAYDRCFPASTLRRTGLHGLRLGAITAAGNVRAESCRAALERACADTDAEIRARAVWALRKLGAPAPQQAQA